MKKAFSVILVFPVLLALLCSVAAEEIPAGGLHADLQRVMNTPVNTRCSKRGEHPVNTHPANTRRMKPETRKPSKIKGFAYVNTLHLLFANFSAW